MIQITEIQIIKDYFEQLCANTFSNAEEMDSFLGKYTLLRFKKK